MMADKHAESSKRREEKKKTTFFKSFKKRKKASPSAAGGKSPPGMLESSVAAAAGTSAMGASGVAGVAGEGDVAVCLSGATSASATITGVRTDNGEGSAKAGPGGTGGKHRGSVAMCGDSAPNLSFLTEQTKSLMDETMLLYHGEKIPNVPMRWVTNGRHKGGVYHMCVSTGTLQRCIVYFH